MITTAFKVKLVANVQDGISDTQPDATFDDTKGYSVGFILLVEDGTTWTCTDATTGAAVWDKDTAGDDQIVIANRKLTELMPRYLNQYFADVRYRLWVSGIVYANGEIDKVGANFDDSFYDGDTLWIDNSRRNDGVYDIVSVTADKIVVSPLVPYDMTETEAVVLFASIFPPGLQDIAARMVWFDVYVRPERNPGMDSEAIGTYSYTKMVSIVGVDYPMDVSSGIGLYRRPKVV